mgnify:CR=1 FL=1
MMRLRGKSGVLVLVGGAGLGPPPCPRAMSDSIVRRIRRRRTRARDLALRRPPVGYMYMYIDLTSPTDSREGAFVSLSCVGEHVCTALGPSGTRPQTRTYVRA